MPRLLAALVATLAFAGCVTPDESVDSGVSADAANEDVTSLAPLGLAATGCIEGGGHSVLPRDHAYDFVTWQVADVLDDVGPQPAYSIMPDPANPIPRNGTTWGNYHASIFCASWTLDGEPLDGHVLGFVGARVEPPEFDESRDDPTHHYLTTVIGTNNDAVYDRLHAAGIHAMRASATFEDVAGSVRIRMSTDHNGDYDSIFKPKAYGPMKATHVRLWLQHENENGTFSPVAIDLLSTAGAHAIADGQGYFSHMHAHHHEPLPGIAGKVGAILYTGFDRELAWGPRPNVAIPWAYEH